MVRRLPTSLKLPFLCACVIAAFAQPSLAQSPPALSIKVVTSSGDQFFVNSVIVEGVHEVMLVDAQLTRTNAERVLAEIKATGKPLSMIYLTHEHADHFLGLQVLHEAYPKARILSSSSVVDRINKIYQQKIDTWQGLIGPAAASKTVAIGRYDENSIRFDGSRIEILGKFQGDADDSNMLWLPGQRTLIAGDVLFNDVHVYTAETDASARTRWLTSLRQIRELNPALVIPGHSKPGAPIDATAAVDFTERYLLVYEQELAKTKEPDAFIKAMKERFPSADFPIALERGAKANAGH